jgi:serine O-acetyltransferase
MTFPPELTDHDKSVSADVPDWTREAPRGFWDPSRKLISAFRAYQSSQSKKGPIFSIRRNWAVLRHRFWSVVTGAEIPLNCRIGGGLLLPHPNGIVIHPDAEIGVNCLIFQQVTIGSGGSRRGVPSIEGHVDIGAGARVLGPIKIGSHARIGANSVVTTDVPSGSAMVGIPAHQVKP